MKKRNLAILLIASMLMNNLSGVFATETMISQDTITVRSTEVSEYKVSSVQIHDNYADVAYEAENDCTVFVGLFNESGTQMYTSAKAEVVSGSAVSTIEFEGQMPEYFLVKAFVLENETNCPLAEVYVDDSYTEYWQTNGYEEPLPFDKTVHGEVVKSRSCGYEVEWSLYEDGMLHIFGDGEMHGYNAVISEGYDDPYFGLCPWYEVKESVKQVYVDKGVTAIGQAAFLNCSNINTIELSSSVVKINESAFYGCSNIEQIKIPTNVKEIKQKAFKDCTSLKAITLPKKINKLADSMFVGCSSLNDVYIPNGVTTIGAEVFSGCTSLTNINIPESVTSLGKGIFDGTPWLENQRQKNQLVIINDLLYDGKAVSDKVEIPEGIKTICYEAFKNNNCVSSVIMPDTVTVIGTGAFEGCMSLASVTLSNGIKAIPDNAFRTCKSLSEITIPSGVTKIGEEAFLSCSRLININLPEGIAEIGDSAFKGCSELTQVVIPDSLVHIPAHLFENCINLETIEFPKNVEIFGTDCFEGTKWINDGRSGNSMIVINDMLYDGKAVSGDAVIPEGITKVLEYAFDENTNLTSVKMPGSLEQIDGAAFRKCSNLTRVELSANIKLIESYAFEDCYNLETIEIPDTVTGIGRWSFANTKWLDNKKEENALVAINGIICDGSEASGHIVIADGITGIGELAFYGSDNIYSVKIPDSVSHVGANAFENCNQLKTIELFDSYALISELLSGSGIFGATKIHGASGSEAETYAKEKNIEFVVTEDSETVIIDVKQRPLPIAAATKALSTVLSDVEVSDVTITIDDAAVERTYIFAVVKDTEAEDLFASSNLLFIDQVVANEVGCFDVTYNITAFEGETDTDDIGNCIVVIGNPQTGVDFGDVDENGSVNLEDAQSVLKAALGICDYNARTAYIADLNESGDITLEDANKVLRLALGIE